MALQPQLEDLWIIARDHPEAADFDRDSRFQLVRYRVRKRWMSMRILPRVFYLAWRYRLRTVFATHWILAGPALLARSLGLVDRVYVAIHGMEAINFPGHRLTRKARDRHRRWVLRSVDGVFPVSRFSGRLVADLGVASDRIHPVPNGVSLLRLREQAARQDVSAFKARHGLPEGPLMASVARLIPRKGVDTSLQAMAQMSDYPELHYVIAGDGPDRARLEQMSRELGIAGRCRFLGEVDEDEKAALYHACEFFVLPARRIGASVEGFGLVFREAACFGKPVIGTTSGGIPDAVIDGQTGLLVSPDDPGALAEAIARLISEPDTASRLGRQGLDLVEREGTWERTAARILRVMESV